MSSCLVWLRLDLPRGHLDWLGSAFAQVEFRERRDEEASREWLKNVSAVFTDLPIPDGIVEQMEQLAWLHATRGGVYPFLCPAIKARPILVTGSRGIHGPRFAEFALALIFALAKKLPECISVQRERSSQNPRPDPVEGKTLGILGLGTIGSELARRARGLGLKIVATKRQVREKPPFVDELWPPERLGEVLSQADFLVVALPSIPSTQGILGEQELRRMKKSAYLINLTQGKAAEEGLLVRALKEGWIAGAALDALPRQPLPEDSELWALPNVIITPRIAGAGSPMWEEVLPIFAENLRRFLSGKELKNVVDKELGY